MGDTPYNNKIDVWSLGITAIEMAEMGNYHIFSTKSNSQDPPNWDLKPFQLMLKLPKDPPPTLRAPTSFSKDFNDFITHCLRKDPNQRPTAKQLLTVFVVTPMALIYKHPFITNNCSKGTASLKELLKVSQTTTAAPAPKSKTSRDRILKVSKFHHQNKKNLMFSNKPL
jgi:STE20-like kinase